ncbi:MAG: phosphodiesterase [Clostridia bacterium]
MRLFVASDLHGSAYYTRLVTQAFVEEKADILVLLGDIYNHGPRNPFPRDYSPMEVAEELNKFARQLVVVQGNCDSKVDEMISQFQFVNMSQMFVGNKKITFTHGDVFNQENIPQAVGDVLCYGHFHTAFVEQKDGLIVANPGSVSLPKDEKRAFLIIDENCIILKDLERKNVIKEQKF